MDSGLLVWHGGPSCRSGDNSVRVPALHGPEQRAQALDLRHGGPQEPRRQEVLPQSRQLRILLIFLVLLYAHTFLI